MTDPHPTPIILTAFNTSESSTAVCRHIEATVREHFPDRPVFWGYNGRTVNRARKHGDEALQLPDEILHSLAKAGHRYAIVQSLHLLPGFEFHQLHQEVRQVTEISCRLGMPLFSSPEDYQTLCDMLTPIIIADPEQAVLLVGHGTRHPIWTAYLALEHLLRQRFGSRMFVGVVEHYPETARQEQRLVLAGFRKVLLIPFFLTTGLHVERDMFGSGEHSLKTRLERCGLEVAIHREGIGMLPGIGELVVQHIDQAQQPQ